MAVDAQLLAAHKAIKVVERALEKMDKLTKDCDKQVKALVAERVSQMVRERRPADIGGVT